MERKPTFFKKDAVVSLILLTTGCYHFRRNNFQGAKTSFDRALNVIQSSHDWQMLGLNIEQYIILLKHLKQAAKTHQPFLPVHLPLQDEMLHSIQTTFTDFTFEKRSLMIVIS